MSILSEASIAGFMIPVSNCINMSQKEKEIIIKNACIAIYYEDQYGNPTGEMSYKSISGDTIAKLNNKDIDTYDWELVEFKGVKCNDSSFNIEFWKAFDWKRESDLVNAFNNLRKVMGDSFIKKLREKAYLVYCHAHSSSYEYEMRGYNDSSSNSEYMTENLSNTYIFYNDKYHEILAIKHYYNRNDFKIFEIDPSL